MEKKGGAERRWMDVVEVEGSARKERPGLILYTQRYVVAHGRDGEGGEGGGCGRRG